MPTSAQVRRSFRHSLEQVSRGERVLITRNGRPRAALVSVEDLKALEEAENERDRELIVKARAEAKKKGWVRVRGDVRAFIRSL